MTWKGDINWRKCTLKREEKYWDGKMYSTSFLNTKKREISMHLGSFKYPSCVTDLALRLLIMYFLFSLAFHSLSDVLLLYSLKQHTVTLHANLNIYKPLPGYRLVAWKAITQRIIQPNLPIHSWKLNWNKDKINVRKWNYDTKTI